MALRTYADGALLAEVFGDPPPRVLALHGWGRRGRDFARSLEGIPTIAPDLPGFGASPAPGFVMGARGYAEIVAGVLPEFERPPVVVGHSFGGRIAVCLAAAYPEKLGPLILTGVPLVRRAPSSQPPLAYRLVRALNRLGLLSDERLEAEKRRRGSADYRAASGVMRDILVTVVHEGYQDELKMLQSEVTLLWGENDREVPPGTAIVSREIMERAGVEVHMEVVPGVGHHLPIEAPGRLRRAVEQRLT